MLNPFVLKKWIAIIFGGLIPVICFFVGVQFYNFIMGLILLGVGLLTSFFLNIVLLRNPFRAMVEGKGLMVFTIDSTGIIRPFIMNVQQPYIKGKLGKDSISDVYDRDAVLSMAMPEKGIAEEFDDKILITITKEQMNKARFGMWQYPVFFYNAQVKSLITKDFLSDSEKQSFAEHGVLYLNRKLEELTSVVRDFGRYVVELTKPQDKSLVKNWVFWAVLIGVAILILLFAKPIFTTIMNTGATASQSVADAVGNTGPVVPRT